MELKDAAGILSGLKGYNTYPIAMGNKETVSKFGIDISGKAARRLIDDNTSAKQQCIAVGKIPTECWLCDTEFSEVPAYKPICDHVLPSTTALFFLDTYSRKDQNNINNLMRIEYEWAHSLCNSIKGGISFIARTSTGNYVIDRYAISRVLSSISEKTGRINNIIEQGKAVESRMTPILDAMNKGILGISNLNTLAGTASVAERIGGKRKTFRRKSNGFSKSRRGKSTIRRNVATSQSRRKLKANRNKRS